MKGKTLIIVASPFQCLCAFEAIRNFDIAAPYYIISGDDNSLRMIKSLLDSKGYLYEVFTPKNFVWNIMYLLKTKHTSYNNIIIGNFESHVFESIGVIYAKYNAQFYYIDDGIQALQVFSEKYVKPSFDFKKRTQGLLNSIIGRIKSIKKPIYYTIFDVQTDKYCVVRNELSLYKQQQVGNNHGVFVIGTNSKVLDFKDHTYVEYLESLFTYIFKKYPMTPIYYCPHRRDIDNDKVNTLCDEYGVEIFDTRVSIEYDLIAKGIYPYSIIGFTSNALYTLKIIFKESKVATVMYHLTDKVADKNTQTIRDNLAAYDVKTLEIL